MIVVGFDPGNSEATLTNAPAGGRSGTSLTTPSFIGSGTLRELRRIRGGAGSGDLEAGEYVLEHGGRSYFVGRLALEQSNDASAARGDVARYWSGHTLRLLLTLAGAMFRANEIGLRVVTGLPVTAWSKETVRQVQQSLTGTHRYTLNGRERTVTVEGVLVLMEGAGALAAHGLAEDVPQAVIDVGGRTTDLFWAQGMRPVLPKCAGLASGVEKAGDMLRGEFEHTYGRELDRHELRTVLRAYAANAKPQPLYVDGAPADLDGWVSAAMDGVAQEIGSFVAQTWRSSERGKVASEAAKVLLIGGGAHYFADDLRRIIPHLEVPRAPELANAQGYLAVGLQVPDERWARLGGR